jgi:predicted tellurium resistance membrane protein TerC
MDMVQLFSMPETYISLVTLTAMEIILGIDNIIFISILVAKLPQHVRDKARNIGLMGALVSRLLLLSVISWIVQLKTPLFSLFGHNVTGQNLILLIGGLFLIFKSTKEIYDKLEGDEHVEETTKASASSAFFSIIVQIMVLDVVFSIDSVITAVGMVPHVPIMVAANVIALAVMLLAGKSVGNFVDRHPSVKMLALSFLMLIGVLLVAEGAGQHIPKGYVYFSMGFSVLVELLNIRMKKSRSPVQLHNVPHEPKA